MKKKLFPAFLVLAALCGTVLSCGPRTRREAPPYGLGAPRLRTGDLIFVGRPADYDDKGETMDEAIASATGKEGAVNLIHVAIAEVENDSVWIIDATLAHGVDRHPLDTFLSDFHFRKGPPVFIVMRPEGVDVKAAVKRARTYCGKAYDVRFLEGNEDLYCTELVQLSYLDKEGQQVFHSEPMNWLAPDGTMPAYWERLFGNLGMPVPQGLPGTNPQRMSESDRLQPVP